MLSMKIKMLESQKQSLENNDSDTSSVASHQSNKSNGSAKSDGSNVFPTGMMVNINGQDYPVVKGPKGGLYSMRADGKHNLTPAQVRNQFPQPKKAANDVMEEGVDDSILNSGMFSLRLGKKYDP
jgi:hypothetical protein